MGPLGRFGKSEATFFQHKIELSDCYGLMNLPILILGGCPHVMAATFYNLMNFETLIIEITPRKSISKSQN